MPALHRTLAMARRVQINLHQCRAVSAVISAYMARNSNGVTLGNSRGSAMEIYPLAGWTTYAAET